MVAQSDGGDCSSEHRCPTCELQARLAEHLGTLSGRGERAWTTGIGGLVEACLYVASTIHEVRSQRFDDQADGAAADRAADAIVGLVFELDRVRERAEGA